MQWILVAVTLYVGDPIPVLQHKAYADKDTCQSAARRFVDQARTVQNRAFCLKMKEKV